MPRFFSAAGLMNLISGDTCLGGDAVVGPVTAGKLLGDSETLEEMWAKVHAAYVKKKKTYADAVLTARLTRILRDGEFDHVTGEVKLWEPSFLSVEAGNFCF